MRFGICTEIENIDTLEKLGFDYIEWAVNAATALHKEEFKAIIKKVNNSSVKCEVLNCFFPWDIKIVGTDVNENFIEEYIKKAFDRLSHLGCKIAVVGNGGARRIPENWDVEKGYEQFAGIMLRIGDEAAQYGITAVIEPLNKAETNLINNLTHGLELVNKICHPNVKILADFFHMRRDNEDVENLLITSNLLRHIHIANSRDRIFPANKEEDDYVNFFNTLKKIGYNERVSIEAATTNLKGDAAKALRLLKELSR